MPKDTLTLTDNRTGRQYEVDIVDETIRAMDLRQIKVNDDDFGLMTYDPGFTNTASCRSSITYIDGDKGILRYRGYPIEQLAEPFNFLQIAYLIFFGELPSNQQFEGFRSKIVGLSSLPACIPSLIQAFPKDAIVAGVRSPTSTATRAS